jgi:predicted RNase H-like HicB family nuclease
VIEPGDDRWLVVECPALPGCISQGKTREEALANIREAMEGYIETLVAHGDPVPEEDVEIETVEVAVA